VVSDTGGYSSRFDVPVVMSWGIYLDSFAGGYTVDHNLCYRTHNGGLMLQGGKANQVFNNIFAAATTSQIQIANFADNTRGSSFHHNIVYCPDAKARLFALGKLTPEVLTADHNLYWQVGVDLNQPDSALAAWRKLGYDAHGLAADPLFVDPAHDDYRLRPESPALKLGFEALDLSQVGPRTKTQPVAEAVPAETVPGTISAPARGDAVLRQAFVNRISNLQVEGEGTVARLLSDDQEGDRHQRFILRLASGQTLLVAHNIDVAPRLQNLAVGDRVAFNGEYEWNEQGGVIHWTHHDPAGKHAAGWLRHRGRTYQ